MTRAPAAWFCALALALAVRPAAAQLPASGSLPEADWPLFRAEIARIEKLLASAPDKAAVTYQMARTWASAKQWPETMEWLRQVGSPPLPNGRGSVTACRVRQ
jgi:hypothetical protein